MRIYETMERPRMEEWLNRMLLLVKSGSREFYTVVE